MKIIIVGAGKLGLSLAESLSAEKHDVTVIDRSDFVLQKAINHIDCFNVTGNGVSFQTQKAAGVESADMLIAVTSSDAINTLCCLVAKKHGAAHTIARIRDPEYDNEYKQMLKDLGVDMVVNPEQEAAKEIARILRYPYAIGIDVFGRGRVELAQMRVQEGSVLDGITLPKLESAVHSKILVCAVERGEEVFIPNGQTQLFANDRIYFTATPKELSQFFRNLGATKKAPKKVFIVGGGRIAYHLICELKPLAANLVVIEKDRVRAEQLHDLAPDVKILCGDGTDPNLLREEGFTSIDASVACTGIDEENMIISMFAIQNRIPKIVTKISKTTLNDMLEMVGLESVVTPHFISADMILSYIRALQAGSSGKMSTLYRLVDGRVQAMEFAVTEGFSMIGKPLREVHLKAGILICCIIRRGTVIFPHGDDSVISGDSIIITTDRTDITDPDDLLK